jgi:hypothetical protein
VPSYSVYAIIINNNDMMTLASDTFFGLVDTDVRGLKRERIIAGNLNLRAPSPETMELLSLASVFFVI